HRSIWTRSNRASWTHLATHLRRHAASHRGAAHAAGNTDAAGRAPERPEWLVARHRAAAAGAQAGQVGRRRAEAAGAERKSARARSCDVDARRAWLRRWRLR